MLKLPSNRKWDDPGAQSPGQTQGWSLLLEERPRDVGVVTLLPWWLTLSGGQLTSPVLSHGTDRAPACPAQVPEHLQPVCRIQGTLLYFCSFIYLLYYDKCTHTYHEICPLNKHLSAPGWVVSYGTSPERFLAQLTLHIHQQLLIVLPPVTTVSSLLL